MAKILLVDDSKVQRHWARNGLSGHEYEFIEASNGLEALGLMEEHQPDLVVCDLNMPTMGGIECVENMKTRGFKFPVVILSADIQDTTKETCFNLGVKEFVNKPIKDDSLLVVVQKILEEA